MEIDRSRYLAYLLRLWQVDSGKESTWRASLEDAQTGKIRGFATLDDLFQFLRQEVTVPPDTAGDQGGHRKGDKPMSRCAEP
jgi:hypothetical protein